MHRCRYDLGAAYRLLRARRMEQQMDHLGASCRDANRHAVTLDAAWQRIASLEAENDALRARCERLRAVVQLVADEESHYTEEPHVARSEGYTVRATATNKALAALLPGDLDDAKGGG